MPPAFGTSQSTKQASRENVRVVCRVRPTNQKEIQSGGVTCVKHTDDAIEVNLDGSLHNFALDRVFGPESLQVEVFGDTAVHLIHDVLAGYNATIFAYGQTGTGKVFLLLLTTSRHDLIVSFEIDTHHGGRYYQ